MANLSNINNKLLVGTNGEVRIGDTATVPDVKLRVKQTAQQWTAQFVNTDSSVAYGISIDTSASSYVAAGTLQCYTNSGGGFIVRNDSRVGIGTATPLAPLHVVTPAVAGVDLTNISRTANNLVRFTNPQYSTSATMGLLLRVFPDSDSRQGAGLLMTGGSDNAASNLSLFVSKDDGTSSNVSQSYSALHVVGNTGNVGIGTASPTSKLHLRDPAANSDVGIKIGNDSRDWNLKVMGSVSDSLQFFTHDNSNVMTILPSGNVGIGTDSPTFQLSIENHATTSSIATFEIDGKRTNGTDGAVGEMIFSNNGDTFATVAGARDGADNSGSLLFQTQDSGTFGTRMRIDASGQIVIPRTGQPPITNSLYGNIVLDSNAVTNFQRIRYDVGTTAYWGLTRLNSGNFAITGGSTWNDHAFSIQYSTQNVGVGMSSGVFPGKFNVSGNSGLTTTGVGDGIFVGPYQGNSAVGSNWSYSNSGYTYTDFCSRYDSSSSFMRFIMKASATPVYAMTIRGDGKVGIGTDSPVANTKLDVVGAIKTQTVAHSWYRCGPITSGLAYRHIKTNLHMGGGARGNDEYIMGGFEIKGYAYYGSYPGFGHGTCMFHNWSGGFASLDVRNFASAGFVQNPYVSSDGFCVIVLRQNSYMQPVIDFCQYYTPYPWRTSVVTAESASANLTGVY